MFCPRCRSEYRQGFSRCKRCDLELIEALPPEPAPEYIEYVQVLGTYNPADIAFIKSVLDAEGIIYYFLGEHFLYIRPLADPARLMVKADQVEKAREILTDLQLTVTGLSIKALPQDDNGD